MADAGTQQYHRALRALSSKEKGRCPCWSRPLGVLRRRVTSPALKQCRARVRHLCWHTHRTWRSPRLAAFGAPGGLRAPGRLTAEAWRGASGLSRADERPGEEHRRRHWGVRWLRGPRLGDGTGGPAGGSCSRSTTTATEAGAHSEALNVPLSSFMQGPWVTQRVSGWFQKFQEPPKLHNLRNVRTDSFWKKKRACIFLVDFQRAAPQLLAFRKVHVRQEKNRWQTLFLLSHFRDSFFLQPDAYPRL